MASGPATVVASAARTVTGNSGALDGPEEGNLALLVVASAVSGTTPSMLLSVEWSNNGTDFAPGDTADVFTAIVLAGALAKRFTVKAKYYRIVWTITGTTPSFTFTISEMGF